MIEKLAYAPVPPADAHVWRYMRYAKFLHLLTSRSLYLARLGRMTDPFEGHLPRRVLREYGEMTSGIVGLGVVGMAVVGADQSVGVQEQQDIAARRAQDLFLNCWHVNDVESEAMWELYGGRGATIAIRSTISRIEDAIRTPEEMKIGAVKYIRFDRDEVDAQDFYAPVFHKRKSFEHEREVRLVAHRPGSTADSLLVEVDLSRLLESVWLAPGTPENMQECVQTILAKFDLNGVPVRGSYLDKRPSYHWPAG